MTSKSVPETVTSVPSGPPAGVNPATTGGGSSFWRISTAAMAERYLTVIPSQTHATLLPYETGSYFPNWVEFGVAAGLFAMGALLIGLFMKVFPIIPMRDEVEEVLADA